MKPVAQNTEVRAALASRTVKKRIRMCGSPAVPNISAMPSEIVEIGFLKFRPGLRIALCLAWVATAAVNMASRLKPKCASAMMAM